MSYLTHRFVGGAPALHRAVARAYYHNAFYRQKLRQAGITPDQVWTPEDLRRVPFTSRAELVGDPWILLAESRSELSQAHVSTGTSGQPPFYVFFSWDDLMLRGLAPLVEGAPMSVLSPIGEGHRVINALPYEVSVTGLAIHRGLQDGIGACVVPVGKGGHYADPDKTIRMMRQLEPDHLFTTPSYALYLADRRDAQPDGGANGGANGRREIGLRSIWLIGESISPAFRRLVERRWQASAFLYYGSLEAGPISVECLLQQGGHVATNFVHVEVAPGDVPARPDLPGELGEIVVTTLPVFLRSSTM